MPKIKCKACGAKPRIQNALIIGAFQVCQNCHAEYSKMFYGFANRETRKKREVNPLFQAFKAGWRRYEESRSLQSMPIDPFIKEQYDQAWLEYKKILVNDPIEAKITFCEVETEGYRTRMLQFWKEEELSQEDKYGA